MNPDEQNINPTPNDAPTPPPDSGTTAAPAEPVDANPALQAPEATTSFSENISMNSPIESAETSTPTAPVESEPAAATEASVPTEPAATPADSDSINGPVSNGGNIDMSTPDLSSTTATIAEPATPQPAPVPGAATPKKSKTTTIVLIAIAAVAALGVIGLLVYTMM